MVVKTAAANCDVCTIVIFSRPNVTIKLDKSNKTCNVCHSCNTPYYKNQLTLNFGDLYRKIIKLKYVLLDLSIYGAIYLWLAKWLGVFLLNFWHH